MNGKFTERIPVITERPRNLARRSKRDTREPKQSNGARRIGRSMIQMKLLSVGVATFLVISALPAAAQSHGHAYGHETAPGQTKKCVHPYPCGDEWPEELSGATFDVLPTEHARVRSSSYEVDGVELDGWIIRPAVPDGVRVPVLLHSTPYLGDCRVDDVLAGPTCRPTPDSPEMTSSDYVGSGAAIYHWGTPVLDLVRKGYAVAMFSLRGTGRSGGCLSFMSAQEQLDQVALVKWAGSQEWSNGRVAMGGISAPAATAWEAATNDSTEFLKTIVTAGIVSDLYTLQRSPQGAPFTYGTATGALSTWNPLIPPLGGAEHSFARNGAIEEMLSSYPARACAQDPAASVRPALTFVSPDRNQSFWDERRLIDRFHEVDAAVLLAQGFGDDGHDYQDDTVWDALTNAPKRRVVGQWAHDFPYGTDYPDEHYRVALDPSWATSQWGDLVTVWLDYWLKGIGTPERLGLVDYQDTDGTWHSSDSWPPKEAKEEALYLVGADLAAEPNESSRSFRSIPDITNSYEGGSYMEASLGTFPYKSSSPLCPTSGTGTPTGVSFLSAPASQNSLIAGNSFAYLRLISDQPGGLVTAKLFDVGPGFTCDELGQPSDVGVIDRGAADLRFHQGNFVASDFPVNQPTHIRIDFADLAYVLKQGHRLAVTLSYGETHIDFVAAPFFPEIEVSGVGGDLASHLIIPFVDGGLGGRKPKVDYPARPFTPER